MGENYKINIFYKGKYQDDFYGIKVFIDDGEVKSKNNHRGCIKKQGKHKIKIVQVKLYKSKHFYILAPIYMILISGDPWILDYSPSYAMYEAEFYLNQDVSIDIILSNKFKCSGGIKKLRVYYFNVLFDNDIEKNTLRNEY